MRSADTDSFYNSLMVGVSKRYAQGLQLQASYTFSRTVDEGSGTQTAGDYDSEVGTQINWENHKMNRGLAAFHVAHNFVLTSTYDLPIGSQWTGAAGMLAKGWQIGGILSLGGGFPFTVTEDSSSSRDATAGGNRPELLPHASNNPVLGGPDKYFDASVFTQVAPGFYGNVGRNTVIGPGSATFDLSLVKMFPISEGKSLQFRSELFNLFNRANFGIPSRTVFDGSGRVGSAGRITRTTSTSRQVQFGLKFVF